METMYGVRHTKQRRDVCCTWVCAHRNALPHTGDGQSGSQQVGGDWLCHADSRCCVVDCGGSFLCIVADGCAYLCCVVVAAAAGKPMMVGARAVICSPTGASIVVINGWTFQDVLLFY